MNAFLLRCFVFLALVTSSCGEKRDEGRKTTFPVTGRLLVDGKPPGSPVAVRCYPVEGIDKKQPTVSSAFTANDGAFQISTYESGDGIPEGKYILTFMWGKRNAFTMQYGGPDKLKGRYSNKKKSQIKVTVTAGEPVDLGTIELTTK